MAVARAMRARLAGIIGARLVVTSLLLGSAVAIGMARPDTFPVMPFVFLIALTYALSIVYTAALRRAVHTPVLVDLQFAIDALLVSACIHITGGISSLFSSLYILPIIAASTIRGRQGALQVASLSATLYAGLVVSQYLGVSLWPRGWWQPAVVELPGVLFAQYTVVVNLGGMFAVALLAGSLAERLRSARAGLQDASFEIADLRAFNAHVVDALTSGLVTTDAGGRILTFNRAATRITRVEREQAIGRDVSQVLQLAGDVRELLPDTEPAVSSRRGEIAYRSPSGEQVDIGFTASRLQFPEGTSGFLITFQDITELKRLEREARLQQRLSAVGEMAAGIAHEIRNPLAAMTGSVEVLKQELPLSGDQAQLLDIVLRESERLNETIRLFVSYARPQRQTVARLDVRGVLRDAASALRNSVDMRDGHTLSLDIPAEPIWHDGDETELRQVLWSLGTNGLRSMPGGGHLRMSVAVDAGETTAPELVFAVQDHGCGIPDDQIEGAFQPFRSSFRQGAGLGLSIVHRIVSDYGGRIQVTSTVGTGTTVCVRLPLAAGRTPAAPAMALPEGRTA